MIDVHTCYVCIFNMLVLSGVAISATMEGMRPMLIETQALVSTAVYGTPQRSATGFDLRRLSMLLAVLEKLPWHWIHQCQLHIYHTVTLN